MNSSIYRQNAHITLKWWKKKKLTVSSIVIVSKYHNYLLHKMCKFLFNLLLIAAFCTFSIHFATKRTRAMPWRDMNGWKMERKSFSEVTVIISVVFTIFYLVGNLFKKYQNEQTDHTTLRRLVNSPPHSVLGVMQVERKLFKNVLWKMEMKFSSKSHFRLLLFKHQNRVLWKRGNCFWSF